MPYKDREVRLQRMKEWRQEKIAEGYGKALYARRAQTKHNEAIFRDAVESALKDLGEQNYEHAERKLRAALKAAPPIGPPIDYMPNNN